MNQYQKSCYIKRTFYSNDTINDTIFSNADKLEGEFKSFYPNGNIKLISNYIDGKLNGTYNFYYEKNEIINVQCVYINGKLHGKYLKFFPNGNIKLNCTYINGIKHGQCKRFYSNGIIESEFTYINGFLMANIKDMI